MMVSEQSRRSIFILPLLMACGPWVLDNAHASEQAYGKGITLADRIGERACSRLDSLMEALERKPDGKIHIIKQRARADAEKIRRLLVSEGYYATKVLPEILKDEDPYSVFTVKPGMRFKITDHSVMTLHTVTHQHSPKLATWAVLDRALQRSSIQNQLGYTRVASS